MSRQIPLQMIRATHSSLATQATAANLLVAEPYLLTDTGRLANGTSATTFNELPGVKTANTMTDVNRFNGGLIVHAIKETVTVANSGAAYTIDLDNGVAVDLTLTANCTLTFPTPDQGCYFRLLLSQDATGNRTVTFPATVAWVGNTAPTLSTSGGIADMLQFIAVGNKWLGSLVSQAIDLSIPAGDVWTERTAAGSSYWQSIASSADGMKLAACANGGYIRTSTDSGATWVERTTSGSRSWCDVAMSSDGTKLVAGVYGGYIYTSTDSGATWTERTSSGTRLWDKLGISDDGLKIIAAVNATSNGYVFRSIDNGVSWVQETGLGSGYWTAAAISPDGLKLVAVRYGDYIYTSTNGGTTWTKRTSSGLRNWRGIDISDDGMKIVACSGNGEVLTSVDNGLTWVQRNVGISNEWYGVSCSSDGLKIILHANGSGKYLYTSTDGGATWTERTSAGSRNWQSITSSANFTKLAACVSGGYIYTSP